MSEEQGTTPQPAGGTESVEVSRSSRRETPTTAAAVLAGIEALAVAAYAVGIGIAAFNAPGTVSAAPVVVVIFLLFAAGIAACARGLWLRRHAARTPFGVVQLFGLVTGWTLTQGDGDTTHYIGYAVLALSVVGIALVINPALGRDLEL